MSMLYSLAGRLPGVRYHLFARALRGIAALACGVLTVAAGVRAADPFLAASGTELRDAHGEGDPVLLRGVNIGGYLVFEAWQTPMDTSGLPDDWSARKTLDERFGRETRDRLIASYEDFWLNEQDFDRIAALGFNAIRVPFWYRNVEEEDGTWHTDPFQRLDWCVAQAWKRGLYTVIDLHGVPGGPCKGQPTGRSREKGRAPDDPDFWKDERSRARTDEIWQRVAQHFKGNPAVAEYDLLNEPYGAPDRAALWAEYDRLYKVIRAADPDHIITMETCWGGSVDGVHMGWGWNVLPPPARFGWTNVVYETHSYVWKADTDAARQKVGIDRQVSDWEAHRRWGVPCYVGEFNCIMSEEAWKYALAQFAAHGMSWTMWSYKSTHGSGDDSWGFYNVRYPGPARPDLQRDSAEAIAQKWSRWSTDAAFAPNPMLMRVLGRSPEGR